MRFRWFLFRHVWSFLGSILAEPLPGDGFHLFTVEELIGEKMARDQGKRRPIVISLHRSLEPHGRLLEVCQAVPIQWK